MALMSVFLAGCEPAARTSAPEATKSSKQDAAKGAPPAPTTTPEELESAVSLAERFARLDTAMSVVRREQEGVETARRFAKQRWGLDTVGVEVISSRSGYPAYKLSSPDVPILLVVIIVNEEVLFGEEGFRRFTELEPRRDPVKWAAAYVHLHEGGAHEPRGPWSSSASQTPQWKGDELAVDYVDNEGTRHHRWVKIGANDRVTARDVNRW